MYETNKNGTNGMESYLFFLFKIRRIPAYTAENIKAHNIKMTFLSVPIINPVSISKYASPVPIASFSSLLAASIPNPGKTLNITDLKVIPAHPFNAIIKPIEIIKKQARIFSDTTLSLISV